MRGVALLPIPYNMDQVIKVAGWFIKVSCRKPTHSFFHEKAKKVKNMALDIAFVDTVKIFDNAVQ